MAKDSQRININVRGSSPCMDCPERFTACSDRCPKDERGEFGYKAWKAEVDRVSKARKEYSKTIHEDSEIEWRNNKRMERGK